MSLLRFISCVPIAILINDMLVTVHHCSAHGLSFISRRTPQKGDRIGVRRADGSRYVTTLLAGTGDDIGFGNVVPHGFVVVPGGVVQRALVMGKVVGSVGGSGT